MRGQLAADYMLGLYIAYFGLVEYLLLLIVMGLNLKGQASPSAAL